LVPEPVAAARYFTDVLRRPVPIGSALAVFDFGGGTLDVAVVRNEGLGPDGRPRFEVASCGGADDLGGLDLDAALVDHLGKSLSGAEPQAWAALTEPVTLAQWRARRQFWDDVRGAKEMLSRAVLAPVPVPGVEQAVHLTRDELEAAADPLIRRGVAEAATVIEAAGLTPGELAGLFLVGGSSRVPLVARLLHAELGIAPTVLEQPELPVAEGATALADRTAAAPAPDAPAVAQPRPAEPEYGEPVDPWATAEAAAFGTPPLYPGSGPPTALANPPTAPDDAPPAAAAKARRRRWIWAVAAAVALVLAAGVSLAVLYWPRFPALDYRAFPDSTPVRLASPVPFGGDFFDTAVVGDRVYFAAGSGSSGTGETAGVVAAEADTGKEVWRTNVPDSARTWHRMFALPDAVVLITDPDTNTDARRRNMVVLDAERGEQQWDRLLGPDDNVLFSGGTVVVVDRGESRMIGLRLTDGKSVWEQPTIKTDIGTGTTVLAVTTPRDVTGPASWDGDAADPDRDDDQRLVQISADRSARVVDAASGDIRVAPRPGVADLDSPMVAHNGRLFVAEEATNVRRILAYDLDTLADPAILTSVPGTVGVSGMTACGDDRVCWIEAADYTGKDAQVAAVEVGDGNRTWRRPVPNAESLVPVGDHVLALRNTSPPSVTMLDPDGELAWSTEGVAARLDAGNVLLTSTGLSTSPHDPAMAGRHLGDREQQLGPLPGVRSSNCSWNTAVIACVAEKDFRWQRFTG
jgi:molecular chaperone HscA